MRTELELKVPSELVISMTPRSFLRTLFRISFFPELRGVSVTSPT